MSNETSKYSLKSLTLYCNTNCLIIIFIITLAMFIAGCNVDELDYDTFSSSEQLERLQNGKVALLAFEYDENLLFGDIVKQEVAQPLAEYHKERLIDGFGTLFDIEDVTNDPTIWKGDKPTVTDQESLRQILADLRADGGILVTSVYGYQMRAGIADAIVGLFTEGSPVDNFPFIEEPSQVLHYFLVSNTYVVNKDGEVIWNFFGKVSKTPVLFTGTVSEEVTAFVNRFAGLNPDSQEMVLALSPVVERYIDFNRWLIEQDIEGSSNKNYFKDYGDSDQESYTSIYPVSANSYVPYVNLDPNRTANRNNLLSKLWQESRASEWRTFGQWRLAWSAFKIMGIFLVIITILGWIKAKVAEDSCLGQIIGIPGFVSVVAFLWALWFFLRAIF